MPSDSAKRDACGDQDAVAGAVARGTKKRKRYRSPARRFVVTALQVSLTAYVALLMFLICMETRLVYPGAYMAESRRGSERMASFLPTSGEERQGTRFSADPEIETVLYDSTDGLTLRGRLLRRNREAGAEYEAGNPDRDIVLFFHGNGVKAAWLDHWLHRLADHFDADVMAAEYRGFEDDTAPTEKGVLADCLAARDFLCARYQVGPQDLILYGQSLGGGCAVAVASRGGAKALILERTFDRLVDVAAGIYPFIPVRWVMRNRYDSMARLTVYRGPLIVIHGTTDELIPISHGRRLYESARSEPKRFIEVEGLGHMEALSERTLREVAQTLRNFFTSDS